MTCSRGGLQADFGTTLKLPIAAGAEASSKKGATVMLMDIQLEKLDGVFLNPRSACATDTASRAAFDSPGGTLARVIMSGARLCPSGALRVRSAGLHPIEAPGLLAR